MPRSAAVPRGSRKPLLLLVLDGWGIRKARKDNAIAQAKTPVLDRLYKDFPHSVIHASSEHVGLPSQTMGNSEVGHLTIGAGRVIDTDVVRINKAILDGSFSRNKEFLAAFAHVKKNKSALHVMGLCSSSSVHSHLDHFVAFLTLAKQQKVKRVYVHLFLDGRDSPPRSSLRFVARVEKALSELGIGTIATLCGRYYAMDRDKRWKRTKLAYDLLTEGKGDLGFADARSALQASHAAAVTDEFVTPVCLDATGIVKTGDSIVFLNFRADRARQLTSAFVSRSFPGFKRKRIQNLHFVAMTEYDAAFSRLVSVAFPKVRPSNTLGEVLSRSQLKQLRVAETEKWAHVTFFFNGQTDRIFSGESRVLLPSRKVATYDKTPAMRVYDITSTILKNQKNYDVVVANFANGDMVGHTGNFAATVAAVEAVDTCIGSLVSSFTGTILITADHGNCEEMTPGHETAHSTNPVPFLAIRVEDSAGFSFGNGSKKRVRIRNGTLVDIAPTVLAVLELPQPREMTGRSLLY